MAPGPWAPRLVGWAVSPVGRYDSISASFSLRLGPHAPLHPSLLTLCTLSLKDLMGACGFVTFYQDKNFHISTQTSLLALF